MAMNKAVKIDADKERNLKFNYNALIMLEEEFGIDVNDMERNMKLSDVRKLIYCGLLHEESDLTLEQVGDIIDEMLEKHGMEYVGQKIGEAFSKAFGTPKSTGTNPKNAKK